MKLLQISIHIIISEKYKKLAVLEPDAYIVGVNAIANCEIIPANNVIIEYIFSFFLLIYINIKNAVNSIIENNVIKIFPNT